MKEAEQGNYVRDVWGSEVEVMGKVMLVEVCLAGCLPSACLKMFRVMYYRFCANRWIQLMHCMRSFIRNGFYLIVWKKKNKLRERSKSLVKFTQVICARLGPGFSFPDSHDRASSITLYSVYRYEPCMHSPFSSLAGPSTSCQRPGKPKPGDKQRVLGNSEPYFLTACSPWVC